MMSGLPQNPTNYDDACDSLNTTWSTLYPYLQGGTLLPNRWLYLLALLGYTAELRDIIAQRMDANARVSGRLMLLRVDAAPSDIDAIEADLSQVTLDLRETARLDLCHAYLTHGREDDVSYHIEQMNSTLNRDNALQALALMAVQRRRYTSALQAYDDITLLAVKLRLLERWSRQEPQWQALPPLRRAAEHAIWQVHDRHDSIPLLQQISRVWDVTRHPQKSQQALWYALTYAHELPDAPRRWRRLCDIAVTHAQCHLPDRAKVIFTRVQTQILQAATHHAHDALQMYCYQQQIAAGFYPSVLEALPNLDQDSTRQHLQRCLVQAWVDADEIGRAAAYLPQIQDVFTREYVLVTIACAYANAHQLATAQQLFAPVLQQYLLQVEAASHESDDS